MIRFFSKIMRLVTRRLFIIALLILIQLLFIGVTIQVFSEYYVYVNAVLIAVSIVVTIIIVNNNEDPGYKLAWTVSILLAPVLGGILYLAVGGQKLRRGAAGRIPMDPLDARVDKDWLSEITDPHVRQQAGYIQNQLMFSPQGRTSVRYFASTEEAFDVMVEQLEAAEHYIFLEYFILEEGVFWDTILEILERKVRQGLDVRLIYDDVGCVKTLPQHYYKRLRDKGIRCYAFNRFVPFISFRMNNRTHRKILVIDGYTGFTGGYNLADEYINVKERFGHWKDTGLMLQGAAVWNLTAMFLHTWNFVSAAENRTNFENYRPERYHALPETQGIIAPYGTTPVNPESGAVGVYCNMIDKAEAYVYITTPYLIPNNEIMRALERAALNGVDVRILTPARWDKYSIHMLTQSNYRELITAGVRIFEYTPGFLHAKSFVSDDEIAIVGTINLDYRSLYLHYEDAVWMYQSPVVKDVKDDFLATQALSEEITPLFLKKRPLHRRIIGWLLKLFAPLV
ncbi:MAG: cardiolipin synthase [Clostridiales bacterium]|nr:cardiolipin synthase [Clostridiales bacterium]